MVKAASGYRVLYAEIPEAIWQRLVDDAEKNGQTVRDVLTEILVGHYRISSKLLPKPKRMGRPPKRQNTE